MRFLTLLPAMVLAAGLVGVQLASSPKGDLSNTSEAAPTGQVQNQTSTRLQVAPLETPTGPVTFTPVSDLEQRSDVVKLQLREATVANTGDWQASFRSTFPTSRGESSCTAVLIGPQVLLTAAHCIPTSGEISYGRTGNPTKIAKCTRHEDWVTGADSSSDFALCRLDDPYAGPPGFKFETVNLTRIAPTKDNPSAVVLTGYGCVDFRVARREQIDGKYRIGLTSLIDSSASPAMRLGADYYAAGPGEKSNLFTGAEGPNLCPGDSGGPAFLPTGIYTQKQYEHRTVIGINSRVFYADTSGTTYGASMISSLAAGQFRAWALRVLGSLPACGLSGSLPNCRQ